MFWLWKFPLQGLKHFGVLLWGLLFGRINQGKSYCLLMEVFIFYEALQFIINRNLDIILFSGTKLDHSFPSAQFWYSLWAYGLDRNSNGGGLLLYVREDTPSKFLKVKSDRNNESICVESNLRKRKWFINGSYNPNKSFLSNHLECFNRIIDEYSKLYQNFLFLGDFNASVSENAWQNFVT